MLKYLLVALCLFTVKPLLSESIDKNLAHRCHQAQKNASLETAINICQKEKLKAYDKQDIDEAVSIISALINLNTKIDHQHKVEALFIELESISGSDRVVYEALRDQGKYYYHNGNFIKAEEYFKKGLKLAKNIAKPEFIAKSLNEMGLISLRKLNYQQALTYLLESLEIKKTLDLEQSKAVTINNIALVYYRLNDNEKALKFYLEALQGYEKFLATSPNNKVIQDNIIHINTDLAAVYTRLGKAKLSQQFLNLVNSDVAKLKSKKIQASRFIDLSEGLLEASDYHIARNFLYKAETLLGDSKSDNQSRLYYLLAKAEFEARNYTSSSIYIHRSIAIAEEFSDNLILLKVYKLHADLLVKQKDFQGAYSSYQKHTNINQRHEEQKFNDRLSQVKLRLETELNDKLLLEKQNEILISDAKNQQLRLYLYTAGAFIAFIAFLLFYISKVNYQKRKQLDTELKIHKDKLIALDKPLINFRHLFSDIEEDILICNDVGFLVFSNIKELQPSLDLKNLKIQEISDELNSGLELAINDNQSINVVANILQRPDSQIQFIIFPILGGDYYVFTQSSQESLSLAISDKINAINRFSQSINSLVIDIHDIGLLRPIIVDTMTLCVDTWINLTNSNKIEFAEQSKIWKVNIDEGRLRTRSLDKYLSLNTLPKQPRLKNVIKTCHFVLSNKEVASSERIFIENQLNKILAFDKS